MSLENIKRIRSHEKFVNGEIDALFIKKPQNIIYILGIKIERDVLIVIPIPPSFVLTKEYLT